MKESNILKTIEIYLGGQNIPTLRLNSGQAWQGVRCGQILKHLRAIALCPQGTADLLAILPQGRVLWIETKTEVGRQRPEQKNFENTVTKLGHTYIIARSVEDVKKYL